MGKAVRVDDDGRLAKALEEGAEFLIVGRRRFRLIEVEGDDRTEAGFYEPTDPEEIQVLEEALNDHTEVLGPDDGRKYLVEQLRKHGIG